MPNFDDTHFIFAHAVKPRGFGSWAFGVGTPSPAQDDILWATGTLTEAKASVSEQVRGIGIVGHVTVYVLP